MLPPGWSLRLHVREDGSPSNCKTFLESVTDTRIDYSASFDRGGAAEARNLALTRVDADFVCIMDADDMLVAGSLARTIDLIRSDECLRRRYLLLLPNGTARQYVSEDALVWRATKKLHASAVSDRHDGWVLAEPAIIYRHHQYQTSRLSSLMSERIEFI